MRGGTYVIEVGALVLQSAQEATSANTMPYKQFALHLHCICRAESLRRSRPFSHYLSSRLHVRNRQLDPSNSDSAQRSQGSFEPFRQYIEGMIAPSHPEGVKSRLVHTRRQTMPHGTCKYPDESSVTRKPKQSNLPFELILSPEHSRPVCSRDPSQELIP
jgi:hypothetical protein